MGRNDRTDHLRKAGMAILTGVGGNLVVFFFLMTFLNVFEALKFIPWILAFNSAASGYGLIIKNRDASRLWKTRVVAIGLIAAGISVGIIALYGILRFGEGIFTLQDLVVYSMVSMVASLLGGLLAFKYIKLNRP